MNEQLFFRDENHIYSIVGSPSDYYTGMTCNGSQVLIVVSFPNLVISFFDQNGNLTKVETKPLTDYLEKTPDYLTVEAAIELKDLFQSIGFQEGVIKVKKFFLYDHGIGINDFSKILIDIINHSSQYCNDEITVAKNELIRWSKEGIFELCLNANSNRWIDQFGLIESS